ncbi:TPA: conjugative transfer signal peptidase TraF [Legionella pneumophila]
MKHWCPLLTKSLAITGLGMLAIAGIGYVAGARINTSKSVPPGLYWITNQPIQKGAFVLVCPSKTKPFEVARARGYISYGFCPGDFGYLIKRVAAMGGDTVTVNDLGVWVNQHLLPYSKPLKQDMNLRPLHAWHLKAYRLLDTEVLLMTHESPTSFDARYFGPLNRQQVQAVLRPVWTWKSLKQTNL